MTDNLIIVIMFIIIYYYYVPLLSSFNTVKFRKGYTVRDVSKKMYYSNS